MLDPGEAREVAGRFGVALDQVRRDHLVSHMLAALSRSLADRILFFGGTALARTLLPNGRLSEDVDLLALGERRDVVEEVVHALTVGVRRTHGELTWSPSLVGIRDTDTAVATTQDGLSVRIQLLDPVGYSSWPYLRSDLEQRFSDAPPACLNVPTAEAFAAWKTAAWLDRGAARDLYDLHGLALAGVIGPEAGSLFVRLGPTATLPQKWMFAKAPTEAEWKAQLGGQTRLTLEPQEALETVREAWGAAAGWGDGGSSTSPQ